MAAGGAVEILRFAQEDSRAGVQREKVNGPLYAFE